MVKKFYCVFDFVSSIEIMPLDNAFLYTSGTMVSWDTSYVKKVPRDFLDLQYSSNGKYITIPKGILEEIDTKLDVDEIYKYELIKNIIHNNGTYSNCDKLVSSSADNSVVDSVKNFDGVAFTGDYGVIAYAISQGTKSVYIIDEEELKRSNGIDNFEEIYRINVGNEIKLMDKR